MDHSDKKKTIQSINPATGQVNREFDLMTDQEVSYLVEQADSTFKKVETNLF
ncbi:MAG: hypothetical protein LUG51_05490 [Tannerellaceae bacterium]|nr:hypothetical protein [Tannerellaceae bacterium]